MRFINIHEVPNIEFSSMKDLTPELTLLLFHTVSLVHGVQT